MQLEFDLEYDEATKLLELEKQIGALKDSSDKIRKRLFSEISELKKLVVDIQNENKRLSFMLQGNAKDNILEYQNKISICTA